MTEDAAPPDTSRGWPVRTLAASPGQIDRFALVVGISNYVHSDLRLRFAARDAARLRETLRDACSGSFADDRIHTLIDAGATLANLNKALRTFLKRPGPNDLVILFFACHGARDPERPDNLYLLPYDADPTDISGTGLPMREVELALRETLHSRRVVILVDACHSGGIGDAFAGLRAGGDPAAELNAYLGALSDRRAGLSLMTSAMANESSVEGEQWGNGHGVFTYFLLEGLRGRADAPPFDGIVTVGELFDYVRRSVEEATRGRQHPHISAGADRTLALAATGSMSAAEHLALADRLTEAAELLDELPCWAGAAAQYAEADRLGAPDPTARISVRRAEALFLAGRAKESEETLLRLPKDDARVRRDLGLLQLASARMDEAMATLLRPLPVGPWATEIFTTDSARRRRRVALLIGLDSVSPAHFSGWEGRLASPVKETRALANLLKTEFEFEELITLLDAQATKSEILKVLEQLAQDSAQYDALVVSFSGHGGQLPRLDAPGRESTLVAYDGEVLSAEIDAALRRSRAGRTTFIASTSHSGLFVERARLAGYEAMSSCQSNQIDMDGSQLGQFFEALLPQLKSTATGAEIAHATLAALTKTGNRQQTPQFAIDSARPPFVVARDDARPSAIAEVLLGSTVRANAATLDAAAQLDPAGSGQPVALEWLRRGQAPRTEALLPHLSFDSIAAACAVLSAAANGMKGSLAGRAIDALKRRQPVFGDVAFANELDYLASALGPGDVMSRVRAVLVGWNRPAANARVGKRSARARVEAVRDALLSAGTPETQIAVLIDQDATRGAIVSALAAAAPASEHPVLVYWCGRGTTSALLCYDGAKLDERVIVDIAGESLTLFTDGPKLGLRTRGEPRVPRLTILRRVRTKNNSQEPRVPEPSCGRHTGALVTELRRREPATSLTAAALAQSSGQPMVVVSAGSDELFPDPLKPRIEAVVSSIRHSEIAYTASLVDRLLERRNGADAEAQLQRGVLQMHLGNTEAAIEALETAVSQFEANPAGEARARLELGRALMKSDRARAVSECRLATRRDPELVQAHYWLGRAITELIAQETTAQAVDALRAYLEGGAPIGRREETLTLISRMLARAEQLT